MSEPIILVVDDEPNVVRLCQRLLERAGFQVVTAGSASQALTVLAHQQVDLLLLDIRMPGVDGFHLLSLARQHQPDLATVIMTGYGTVDIAISALQEGADALILKPFSGADLVQNVERVLKDSQRKREVVRLRALRPLFDVTETLFAQTDPSRLQELIVEAVCARLNCSAAGLYQRDRTASPFQLVNWVGEVTPLRIGLAEQDPLEQAALSSNAVWVNHEGPGDIALLELLEEQQLSSLICTPVSRKNMTSLLLAVRKHGEPFFHEADLEMLLILGRQAAVALENASLYNELRAYIRQVEKSQAAMIQAEKMAAAGRLTASIAHEINNPLQSLHNCLHLADRKELSQAERDKYLLMAQAELDRLMFTVQRMLDYYRPGARDRQFTDINELIRRVLLLLESQLENGKIVVRTYLSNDLSLVLVVASQIQQVLLNLILNSMEAMVDGGEITIETAAIKPSRTAQQAYGEGTRSAGVEIIIEDSGPGIPDEERERIFEPFISTKEYGTGLGLAVSYGIVTAHGGTLSLLEGRGKGACFRITLPEDQI